MFRTISLLKCFFSTCYIQTWFRLLQETSPNKADKTPILLELSFQWEEAGSKKKKKCNQHPHPNSIDEDSGLKGRGRGSEIISISFPGGSVKNLRAVQETQVRSLGLKDPLEEEMGTSSSILAWRIPWVKEPGGLHFMGSPRVRHDRLTNTFSNTKTGVSWGLCWPGHACIS